MAAGGPVAGAAGFIDNFAKSRRDAQANARARLESYLKELKELRANDEAIARDP
jgi:hypothetical protein